MVKVLMLVSALFFVACGSEEVPGVGDGSELDGGAAGGLHSEGCEKGCEGYTFCVGGGQLFLEQCIQNRCEAFVECPAEGSCPHFPQDPTCFGDVLDEKTTCLAIFEAGGSSPLLECPGA